MISTIMLDLPSLYHEKPSGVARFGLSLALALSKYSEFNFIFRSSLSPEHFPPELSAAGWQCVTQRPAAHHFRKVISNHIPQLFGTRSTKVDLILSLDPFGNPFDGQRSITVIHDLYFKVMPALYSAKQRIILDLIHNDIVNNSTHIVTNSSTTAVDLKRFYSRAKDKTSTIFLDSTLPLPAAIIQDQWNIETPYILSVGNTTPNKNFETFVRAIKKLAPIHPELNFVHVGNDSGKVFGSILFPESKDSFKFTQLTNVSDSLLTFLYQNAVCLCVPSLYEGFCLPIIEAQQLGCPVVCSNRSATLEIGGDGALFFDPSDLDELVLCLLNVVSNDAIRIELSKKGRINAGKFSWDEAALQYVGIFRRLLSGNT